MPEAVSGCITQSFQVTGGIRTGCCQAQSFAEVLQVFFRCFQIFGGSKSCLVVSASPHCAIPATWRKAQALFKLLQQDVEASRDKWPCWHLRHSADAASSSSFHSDRLLTVPQTSFGVQGLTQTDGPSSVSDES